jgi:L-cystine transport system ATP-binding protein
MMIQIKNVCCSINRTPIIKHMSLSVNKGEVLGIIGPSGAGKTTLLRCINYLAKPEVGEIDLDGFHVDYKTIKRKQIAYLRKHTAMVFQHYSLFHHKSVLTNITECLRIVHKLSKQEAEKRALSALESVGLLEKRDQYPACLSGGQMQRVNIARALAIRPDVILFDEPTSALDMEKAHEVLVNIKHLAKMGITMILVSHELSFTERIADQIIFMENGSIVESGTAFDVFNQPKQPRTFQFLNQYKQDLRHIQEEEGKSHASL